LRAGPLVRATRAALAAAALVVLMAAGSGASTLIAEAQGWSQYQGDAQHTGAASAAPAPPFGVAWSRSTGIGDETHFAGIPSPVIAGDDAIVVDREDLSALSLTSGAVAWSVPRRLGPSAPAAVVTTPDTTTIVYTEGGGDLSSSASGTPTPSPSVTPPSGTSTGLRPTLVAIDASTRRTIWRRPLPDVSIGGPTIDGDTVLVGTDDGSLTAVALGSGDQRWTVDLGDSINTPVAASDGTAFVAVSGGSSQPSSLVTLRETDGSQVWHFTAGASGISIGAPALANGSVYVSISDGSVRAFDAGTGAARWASKLNTVSGGGSPAVVDDAVVVADIRGQVYRLSASTGARVWDFAMNTPVYGAPVIGGSVVVVGDSAGDVSAIDLASGERIWRQNVGDGLLLGWAVTLETIIGARTGPAAGLVALGTDPGGVLIREQSPTITEPVQLGLAWAAAAVPLVLLLILAGRFLAARMGPTSFGSEDASESMEDDLA
jgi:outer membrane protein assembly factor BamB